MKRRQSILLLLLTFGLTFLSGCLLEDFDPTEWALDPELEFASQSLTFGPFAEKQVMKIQCNYNEITAFSNAEWCHVRASMDSLCIIVEVDDNHENGYRIAEINVVLEKGNKMLSKSFNVIQNVGEWEMIGVWKVFWAQDINNYQKTIITDLIQNLVKVKKGTFQMGGQGFDSLAANYYPHLYDSSEVHSVTLTKDYYINRYEVSQKEWGAVMDNNPSRFVGDNLPVENITWNDAIQFVERLSNMTGLDFRLPTSAQWEYAAQGGKYNHHYYYSGSNTFTDVGKYVHEVTDLSYTTDDVGSFAPNELGLYNMSGNVAEICMDWFGYYTGENETDPLGPSTGSLHVTRGGCFCSPPSLYCSVYSRWALMSSDNLFNGIRIIAMP